MHRFYVPQDLNTDVLEVSGDEAAHMLRVLRLTVGDRVSLFDGDGQEVIAEITGTRKHTARLRVRESSPRVSAERPAITLVTAVPKSDRFRWLVEKVTELGVQRLIPVRTERSVVHPRDGKLEKMQAASIAACKQCQRNDLLQIQDLLDWTEMLRQTARLPKLIAHPGGSPMGKLLPSINREPHVVLIVGPEGGLTEGEVELARAAGGNVVQLGQLILRIETAALSMVAAIRLHTVPPSET
ncbi:MAG: 16S rRNA (uracil(1498)-N(3))-methyltransferase [Planctomycetaceae bacterium]|nr:16S rRNA (uracil(1498)-N(3))-methyltransferase [Planctomycetaceae bacterium]